MIRRIQALNYRCLRYVDVDLDRFQVLVGPNGSGKSALLDVIAFVKDLAISGLEDAVFGRANNIEDLVWGRRGQDTTFELALEFDTPKSLTTRDFSSPERFRYELAVCKQSGSFGIAGELLTAARTDSRPSSERAVPSPVYSGEKRNDRVLDSDSVLRLSTDILRKISDSFPEVPKLPSSSLDYVPSILKIGVRELFLDTTRLSEASPPKGRSTSYEWDGSHLPWTVKRLESNYPEHFKAWLRHVRTAIRDLEDIRVVEREDDRHAYLMVRYANGVEAPSWTVSEGTLRLLALTIIGYLPNRGLYLVEEPENGIHPLAVETVYQSLSSVSNAQVLIASHSPELLMCAKPKDVLCFSKDGEGATQIIRGDQHPRLAHWRSAADVDLLFASEILG